MENLVCLVSGIRDGILGDIVKRLLRNNHYKARECSGSVIDFIDKDVSCVIVGMGNKCLPVECKNIFKKNNELMVIEILNNGKSLGLYLDDINEKSLDIILNIKKQHLREI